MPDPVPLDAKSLELRRTIVRIMDTCGRGHLGAAFSRIEILRVLYDDVLRYDARNPTWTGRDRCILSKGHGCLALYVVLAEKGFFPQAELWTFCSSDSLLGGHPEVKVPGVEASTGSLGHGLPIAVGMALAAKHDAREHRVFVIVGDGECNEGSTWEAALHANKHRLDNLLVLVDYNKHQSYGPTAEVLDLEPLRAKWEAFGFGVAEVDGHDVAALKGVLDAAPFAPGRPSALICHTVKGKGTPQTENDMAWHHKSGIPAGEIQALLAALGGDDA